MTEDQNTGSGAGAASDAEVQTISSDDVAVVNADALAEQDAKAKEANLKALTAQRDGLVRKVEKLSEHLEGAKAALEDAEDALSEAAPADVS